MRSASNAYFSHTLSVISIPDKTQELYKALNEFYEGDLEEIENLDELISTIRRKRYAKLHSFDPEAVWNAIQNRKEGVKENTEDRSIKLVELEALLQTPLEHSPEAQQNKSKDNLDFEAAKQSPDSIPVPWKPYLNQVVLVHRLREVIAQVGFTRFESSLPDVAAGELDINPRRASLGRDMKWVPTIENKGKAFFCPSIPKQWKPGSKVPMPKSEMKYLNRAIFNGWTVGGFPGITANIQVWLIFCSIPFPIS